MRFKLIDKFRRFEGAPPTGQVQQRDTCPACGQDGCVCQYRSRDSLLQIKTDG